MLCVHEKMFQKKKKRRNNNKNKNKELKNKNEKKSAQVTFEYTHDTQQVPVDLGLVIEALQ